MQNYSIFLRQSYDNLIQISSCDYAQPWQIGFQDAATPIMEGIVDLHHDIMFFLVIICFFVLYLLLRVVSLFHENKNNFIKIVHGKVIEIVWTITPSFILAFIAVPSFALLYSMDEVIDPAITIKAIGHQWYWCAPFNYYYRRNWEVTSPVSKDCKGTNLSDAERLGECSMFVKALWPQVVLGEKESRPTIDMVICRNPTELDTAPAMLNNKKCNRSNLSAKDQLVLKDTLESLSQQGRQDILPKSIKHGNNRNWGFPKGGNSYAWTRDKQHEYKPCGNGALVVWKIHNIMDPKEGVQPYRSYATLAAKRTSRLDKESVKVAKPTRRRRRKQTYWQLYQMDLLKTAYLDIKSEPRRKPGNLTPGVDQETLDGISLEEEWPERTIGTCPTGRFQLKPARRLLRRVDIPKSQINKGDKKNAGKTRPLGMGTPTPGDKVEEIQRAYKMIFVPESVYEPWFSQCSHSHGFRPSRSPHTAIAEVRKWSGTTWIIEGDIKGYFDNIDHNILAKLLEERIKDQNLIDVYWKLVKGGYVEEKNGVCPRLESNLGAEWGTPLRQGGRRGVSPILRLRLSNIYLDQLDKFVEGLIAKYSEDDKRVSKHNPEFAVLRGDSKNSVNKSKDIEKLRNIPTMIRDETTGYRIRYNRFADDWIIGISGPLEFAKDIKEKVRVFLEEKTMLEEKEQRELPEDKTRMKITHIASKKVKYLGYEIGRRPRKYTESLQRTAAGEAEWKQEDKPIRTRRATNTRRRIQIYAPISDLIQKLIDHGFARSKEKPRAVSKWIYLKPHEIITRYNATLRGIVNYYSASSSSTASTTTTMVVDAVENKNLLTHVIWMLKFSAAYTLARKWRISPAKVFKKLGKDLCIRIKEEENVNSPKPFDKRKEKTVCFYTPDTLARNRKINTQKYNDRDGRDPFIPRILRGTRSNHVWDSPC